MTGTLIEHNHYHHPTAACLAAACLAAVLLSAVGCSDQYEHERLDAQSAEFKTVQSMLDELRSASKDDLSDVLGRQIASGLAEPMDKGLRAVLGELARADWASVELVDRWGDWYRATIKFTSAAGPGTLALLLVRPDDGKLYWAKTN